METTAPKAPALDPDQLRNRSNGSRKSGIRLSRSRWIIASTSVTKSAGRCGATCCRGVVVPVVMALNTWPSVSPSIGLRPLEHSYKMTPSAQTSTRASTSFSPKACSGAM